MRALYLLNISGIAIAFAAPDFSSLISMDWINWMHKGYSHALRFLAFTGFLAVGVPLYLVDPE